MHGPTVSQPCWPGSPYQPIPVDQQRVRHRSRSRCMESQRDFPGVTAQVQPVMHYQQPVRHRPPPDPRLPAADHRAGGRAAASPGDRLLRAWTWSGRPGWRRSTTSSCAAGRRQRGASVNAAGQVTARFTSRHPAGARRRPGHQPQRQAPAGRAERPGPAPSARREAEGNPGATTGAAVVMTTKGRVVAMASYPTYNPSIWTNGISAQEFHDAVRQRPRRADPEPRHPGRVRAGLDLEGDSTAAARRGRVLAVRPLRLPGRGRRSAATSSTTTSADRRPDVAAPGAGACPATRSSTDSPTTSGSTTTARRTS